jgi:hypothetical protein
LAREGDARGVVLGLVPGEGGGDDVEFLRSSESFILPLPLLSFFVRTSKLCVAKHTGNRSPCGKLRT